MNQRIIGLPHAKLLYEGPSALTAKTTYIYDLNGEYLQALPATPIQHDGSFSTDPMPVRGNLVKVQRWDLQDPNNAAKTEDKIGYDITGNVIFTRTSSAGRAQVHRLSADTERVVPLAAEANGNNPFRSFRDGREVVVRAGESLWIPPNAPHSAEALEDTVDIDVFSPPRTDWQAKDDAYLR